ncbi:MAG: L-threonylcarbamoyladenylate synthase [Candidatus Saccharimonadales bacterium]
MEVLAFYPLSDSHAIELLQNGAVGVMPTDTVYGIVAQAANKQAVAKLYKAKHRDGKPGTVIAANVQQLESLGIKKELLSRVAHLWPNSVSVVLLLGSDMAYLHQGLNSLAVRVPKDLEIRKLLEQTGPILTSSANMPGEPPATTLAEAEKYFGNSVDFYVDGGDLSDREPSTIVRLTSENTIEVLRQGAIYIENKELQQ